MKSTLSYHPIPAKSGVLSLNKKPIAFGRLAQVGIHCLLMNTILCSIELLNKIFTLLLQYQLLFDYVYYQVKFVILSLSSQVPKVQLIYDTLTVSRILVPKYSHCRLKLILARGFLPTNNNKQTMPTL